MLQLAGREKDLGGGLRVRRLLPATACRTVGPFVFLDHFGPVDFVPGMNIDVRAHPHIGLATVTYLFEGAMMHRDSLGSVQRIEPGAINWMSAGRGIVHSERTPSELRAVPHRSHGLQLWVGLPQAMEESAPTFSHTPAALLAPFVEQGGEVRLLVGEAFGRRSPVVAASPTVFMILQLKANAELQLPVLAPELAIYPIEHDISVNHAVLAARTLGVLECDRLHVLKGDDDTTVAMIGGAPLDGARILSWNFVSSSKSRIERAAEDWRAQRMGSVPGETDFIPLPDQLPT
jgi:redox-sensitive bicupin YhaK (pirin superfamily)